MSDGIVKFYNRARGFGFIHAADGHRDVVVHATALERAGITGLAPGQRIEFDLELDRQGRSSAANVRLL